MYVCTYGPTIELLNPKNPKSVLVYSPAAQLQADLIQPIELPN